MIGLKLKKPQGDRDSILFVGSSSSFPVKKDSEIALAGYKTILLHAPRVPENHTEAMDGYDKVFEVDFDDQKALKDLLEKISHKIVAVTTRSELNSHQLIKIIPFLPKEVLVPPVEPLEILRDKKSMREFFTESLPEYSPKVAYAKKGENIDLEGFNFPVIVKPTDMFGSQFIRLVESPDEVHKVISEIRSDIEKESENLSKKPNESLIIEEFFIGPQYTLDAYVNKDGKVLQCPLVRMIPAFERGGNHFGSFLTYLPVDALSESRFFELQVLLERSVSDLGLKSTTLQVDTVLTKDGWKIVEMSARLGSQRRRQYRLAYGFDHGTNDIRIRLGLEPIIKKEVLGTVAIRKVSTDRVAIFEGFNKEEIKEKLSTYLVSKTRVPKGEKVYPVNQGGVNMFSVIFFDSDRQKVFADLEEFEKILKVDL